MKKVVVIMFLASSLMLFSCKSYRVSRFTKADKENIGLKPLNLVVDVSACIDNDMGKNAWSMKHYCPKDAYRTIVAFNDNLTGTSIKWDNSLKLESKVSIPWEFYSESYYQSKSRLFYTPKFDMTGLQRDPWFNFTLLNNPLGYNPSHTVALGYKIDGRYFMPNLNSSILSSEAPVSTGFVYTMDGKYGDLIDIYTYDMKRNVMAQGEKTEGTATLKVLNYETKKNPLLFIVCGLNYFSLFYPAMLGLPYGHNKGKIELQMDINDKDGKLIKSYTSKATKKSVAGFYYGYGAFALRRASHSKALRAALKDIKKQIKKDVQTLNSQL